MTEKMTHSNSRLLKAAIIVFMAVCFLLLTLVSSPGLSLADTEGLTLVESFPKDGATNAAVENLGVKLTFNNPVNKAENHEANLKCFTLIGPEGTKLPIKVYYNPKNDCQLLVLYDTTETGPLTASKSEHYELKVSGEFVDNNGNKLGKDIPISFDTINQSFNTKVYMVIMLLMVAGMAFFTTRQTQKKMAENDATGGRTREEAFNPYKEAKRTGKSVAEVMAIHEREVAKAEAKAAKNKSAEYDDFDDEDEEESGNYKVKGPRPISAGGSTFITGRKALAEAKAAEEERLAKRRANAKRRK